MNTRKKLTALAVAACVGITTGCANMPQSDAVNKENIGTVVGAVFVGVLLNGLTMLNAPYYTQDFVKGAVLVGALAMTYGLGRARS